MTPKSAVRRLVRGRPSEPTQFTAELADTLGLALESTAELLGFEIAAVGVVEEDRLLFVAAAADDAADRDAILGASMPMSEVAVLLDSSERFGPLEFVPRAPLTAAAWICTDEPDPTEADHDGPTEPWHPHDIHFLRLIGADGGLLGLLSLDRPRSRLRPTVAEVREVTANALLATRAVVNIVERQRLDAQVARATALQRIIRDAAGHLSVEHLLAGVEDHLVRIFDADRVWVHVFGEDDDGDEIHGARGLEVSIPPTLRRVNRGTAERYWSLQEANVVSAGDPPPAYLEPEEVEAIGAFQAEMDIHRSLFAALGVGQRCVGNVVITRRRDQPRFSAADKQAAVELGLVLGQAVVRTRLNERQRQLVEELRMVDRYKTQVIATLAHELKNPLTAVLGYVEVLQGLPETEADVSADVQAMAHQGLRMRRLVGDMLVLSRLAEGNQPVQRSVVSVRSAFLGALPHLLDEAGVERLRTRTPDDPVMVTGDAADLERLCGLLMVVGLARSAPDAEVHCRLGRDGDEVVITCDHGRAPLSPTDRELYFDEFTRPGQVTPGTGLELAICRHIVRRHGGSIRLLSPDGSGINRVEVRLAGYAFED